MKSIIKWFALCLLVSGCADNSYKSKASQKFNDLSCEVNFSLLAQAVKFEKLSSEAEYIYLDCLDEIFLGNAEVFDLMTTVFPDAAPIFPAEYISEFNNYKALRQSGFSVEDSMRTCFKGISEHGEMLRIHNDKVQGWKLLPYMTGAITGPLPGTNIRELYVPNDRNTSYYLYGLTIMDNDNIDVVTRREGVSGTSYARREINCKTGQFRYLGDKDRLRDLYLTRIIIPRPWETPRNTDIVTNISGDIVRDVCN